MARRNKTTSTSSPASN